MTKITEQDIAGMGLRIKEAREGAGYTQRELGDLIGIHHATLCNIEREAHGVGLETIAAISDRCGVSIDWLVWG